MSESLNLMALTIKKCKIFIGIFFILIVSRKTFGQQDVLYLTYPQNPLSINPAYAGSNGIASISIIARKQSLVLQGIGSSQFLSYNTPLAKGKFGMGLQAFNSNFGQVGGGGGTGINLGGAFRHHFSDSVSISIGAKAGFVQIPGFTIGANYFKPIAGVGAYFRNFNSYIGVSMPVITKPFYQFSQSTKDYFLRPLFISAGHVLNFNENLDLKFGVVYRQYDQNKGGALDLNATIWLKKRLGLGIWKNKTGSEVNAKNAFILSADAQLNQKFRIGISYDFAASNNQPDRLNPTTGRNSSLGIYNLVLRYDFDNLTGKINNFRYF